MGCYIYLAPSVFPYASSQGSLNLPINFCFPYGKDANRYLSQKDVDPCFLDYEDEGKGLHTPGVSPHYPMGQRELSPPGATFSTWNSVAQGPPFSSWQKTYNHYLLHKTGFVYYITLTRGQHFIAI